MTIASMGRVLLLSCLLSAPPAAASTPRWAWPIEAPHTVQAPFVAPATPYAPGHRGIDVTAPTGVAVSAAAPGVVTFSGVVVDRPLVVIRHDDGLVSSIEPVVGSVSVGDTVARGAAIGTVGDGGHCDGSCVHFGVRRDGAYINPLLLLDDVPAAVLLPVVRARTAQ
ncbi:MAG TPA: M23 family metallopeptidase [Plantibacter sp.]|uniref:M23 family metallopeptidase n=1 Tax=unclassified Plantibacter TaxID=2624265 RepID=UPI002C9A3E28|nr:M23 family metallopeptidase [Plantibacter sp.]